MAYFKAHHYTKVGMIYSTDAYGASVGQAAIAAAKQAGITLTTATYEDTDLNMTAELQQLQAAHPQALYVQGFGAPPGIILQDQYALGWKIPTVGDLTTASTPVIWQDSAKPEEKGLLLQELQVAVHSGSETTALTNYIKAMQKFGPITSPLPTTSYEYDAVMLVAQAAKQADSIATPAMANALEHLKQPASLAVIGFVALAIGGYGSIVATTVGAFGIGLVQQYTSRYIGANYENLMVFAILVVVLMALPNGLAGARRERVV